MSVLVKIYKVPEPEHSEVSQIALKACSDVPFQDDDFLRESIDLNEQVSGGQGSTFYAKIKKNNNSSAYKEGDVLVVNRSWPIQNNKLVVCCIDGEFVLKRVNLQDNSLWLESPNGLGAPVLVSEENQFIVWGVVTHELRRLW